MVGRKGKMKDTIEMLDELIDLTEWKTRKQIDEELKNINIKLNERSFRQKIEEYNELFFLHRKDTYMAHSSKGYKLTKDETEIRDSIKDNFTRGIDQLQKYHKGMRALGENANFKLSIQNNELIFVED